MSLEPVFYHVSSDDHCGLCHTAAKPPWTYSDDTTDAIMVCNGLVMCADCSLDVCIECRVDIMDYATQKWIKSVCHSCFHSLPPTDTFRVQLIDALAEAKITVSGQSLAQALAVPNTKMICWTFIHSHTPILFQVFVHAIKKRAGGNKTFDALDVTLCHRFGTTRYAVAVVVDNL